ncbi:hypothetical protein BCR34DRAFT_607114 [Clohesyomyces aquaticus]|uniref:Uncharacterized protein n=1 Tax=Clohesyomyces aquaticus TaxID=1231657 RepID=A0A1Y1YII6_9PLEO|nr:hypothetical protein BCR34DRAFT_607114 [Clohesyomyces aquaticus]
MSGTFTDDEAPAADQTSNFLGILTGISTVGALAFPEAVFASAGLGLFGSIYIELATLKNPQSPAEKISNYFSEASAANPEDLVQIRMNGEFTADKTGAIAPNEPAMMGALYSVVINLLWNSEHIIVVKIDAKTWDDSICGGAPIWGGNTYCTADLAHADTVEGIDKLEDYKLDLGKVVTASEWAQSITMKWRSEVSGEVMRSAFGHGQLGTAFNLPFCDLERLVAAHGRGWTCNGHPDCYKNMVMCLCGNLKDVDGNYIPGHADWMENEPKCNEIVVYTLGTF